MIAQPNWIGDVSHETRDRLSRYVALILKWNPTINLIGKATEIEIWSRHIWDSYQLLPLIPFHVKQLVDLGSGGGLPGLVIACAWPELSITLVERDQRKASFLREAARSLGLEQVRVVADDVKNLREPFDCVTSRALASLDALCEMALPILGKDAICLFPKGENFAREIVEARQRWSFGERVIHSKTHEKACIVSVSELKRRDDGKQ